MEEMTYEFDPTTTNCALELCGSRNTAVFLSFPGVFQEILQFREDLYGVRAHAFRVVFEMQPPKAWNKTLS